MRRNKHMFNLNVHRPPHIRRHPLWIVKQSTNDSNIVVIIIIIIIILNRPKQFKTKCKKGI